MFPLFFTSEKIKINNLFSQNWIWFNFVNQLPKHVVKHLCLEFF